jgi:hypothetical protein
MLRGKRDVQQFALRVPFDVGNVAGVFDEAENGVVGELMNLKRTLARPPSPDGIAPSRRDQKPAVETIPDDSIRLPEMSELKDD